MITNSLHNLIFLCHAIEDKKQVRELYQKLKKANYQPWLDEIDILPGQDWNYEIEQALNKSSFILICLSKQSVAKRGYLNKEIKWALGRKDEMLTSDIFIIPVKLTPCELPYSLERIQYVELFKDNGFKRLQQAIDYQLDRCLPKNMQIKNAQFSESVYGQQINSNYEIITQPHISDTHPILTNPIEIPFKILIIGIFLLKQDEKLIENRKRIIINRYNFNEVLKEMNIELMILCQNRLSCKLDKTFNVRIKLNSMTSFTPDSIVKNTPELNKIFEQRSALVFVKNYFDDEPIFIKQILNLINNIDVKALKKLTDEYEFDDLHLDDVIQTVNFQNEKEYNQIKSGLKVLITEIVRTNQRIDDINSTIIDGMIAEYDERLSSQMDEILHHPDFKKMESAWRSLKFLVDRTDFSKNIQIEILNASKKDLNNDFKVLKINRSGLFKIVYSSIYKNNGQHPYGAIIGNFQFSQKTEDITLLKNIASIAAMAHAPFIASVSSEMFKINSFSELSNLHNIKSFFKSQEYDSWHSFRKSENSRYIGLTLPRFLLRSPFGKSEILIKTFNYEEKVLDNHENYLWGNSAFAFASRLTDSFAKYKSCVNIVGPMSGGTVESLPIHFFKVVNDLIMKIPTDDVSITQNQEYELSEEGFIPLIFRPGSGHAVFYAANSVHKTKHFENNEEDREAERNYKISIQLPYLLLISRYAHFIKVIQRDKTENFISKNDLELLLNKWIKQYISKMKSPQASVIMRKPLYNAHIQLEENEGKPDFYQMKLKVIPHHKNLGQPFTLTLISQLEKLN